MKDTITKVGARRVQRLIDHMAKQPSAKHFEMGHWFDHEGDDSINDHGIKNGTVITQKHIHACGTTACAAGHAASLRYFRRIGIRVVYQHYEFQLVIDGSTATGWDLFNDLAVKFGVSIHQADQLFGSHNKDHTPKQWAQRAGGLLKSWVQP